ncbi:MAG: polysaccharide biosynthesis tyrosine autokinase [Pseudomonadota bacterium]
MTSVNPQMPVFSSEADDDEIDFRELIGSVVQARWWVAGFTAFALMMGFIYTQVATPIYQVNALLQVESNKGSMGAIGSEMNGLFEEKTQANTEIELISSRMVLGKAANDLNLDIIAKPFYFPVFGKLFSSNEPRILRITRLNVPEAWNNETLILTVTGNNSYDLSSPTGELLGRGRADAPFSSEQGDVGLFVSELRAPVGQRFAVVKLDDISAIERLAGGLSLKEKGRSTGLIELTYQTPDVLSGVRVLNQIANNYVRQNVERKSAEAQQTLSFIEQQLPELKKQLEASEVRFNEYRSRIGSVDIGQEGSILLQQSVGADTSLVALQQKRKELLTTFTFEHPSVITLDKQIASIRSQQNQFSGKIDRLPKDQQELLRLTRDLQVNQELYTGLLNNSQQLKVVRAGTVGSVRVVDYATKTPRPIAPEKMFILLSSLLLGLLSGVGFAVLRQILKSGVKEAKQIESKLGLPVLATIPISDAQSKIAKVLKKSGGTISILASNAVDDLAIESLRSLRTSLHFTLVDAPNNIIMITGPSPSVGKSFISVNFAAVMASTGQRILVIDADLRRGYLNEYLGQERFNGLSELIAQDLALENVIKPSGVAGLDFVTTGALPPNPAELLLHPRFEVFLKAVSLRYDYVIIDSPPVMAVTDAAIVGRHAGATLLVARFGFTPLRELELSVKRLQQAGVSVNGVLLNRVESAAGYGYGYGYKYAYAYRYGQRKS